MAFSNCAILSLEGAPGPPGEPFISRYGAALTLHWTSGDQGRAPITRYVVEARPSGEPLLKVLVFLTYASIS